MSESESASEAEPVESPPALMPVRRPTQPSQSTSRTATTMRNAGRVLPWLPFIVATLGALLVLWNIASISGERLMGATSPFPTATTTVLAPAEGEWASTGTSPGPPDLPNIIPAELNVEIISFDVASQTISARLSLAFNDSVVAHIQFFDAARRAFLPLTAVRQDTWANLLVGIQLTACLTSSFTTENCERPVATAPFSDLVSSDGQHAALAGFSVPGTVTLPVSGWPNRFPSDVYELRMTPYVRLSPGLVFPFTEPGAYTTFVPTNIYITADPGLADHTLTVVEDSPTNPLIIGLLIGRSRLYQITIYIVALLPLLLGAVIAHISLRRRQPVFDLGFFAGLIAAMLAILPLRAVLVPTDLGAEGLTLVDDILVLGVLLIAALLFFQYARVITMRPKSAPNPQSHAHPDHTEAPESSPNEPP